MKNARKKENDQNTDSFSRLDMAIHGPENGHFSQRIVFTLHLGFAGDFRRMSYSKRQKKGTFSPEVLIQRS